MTTKEQRDELRKVAMAATHGPWAFIHDARKNSFDVVLATDANERRMTGDITQCGLDPWVIVASGKTRVNAAYIALANPKAILALLDQLDSQQPAETRTYEDGLRRAAEICKERAVALDFGGNEYVRYPELIQAANIIEQEAKK